ncbi:TIGR03435 family protein [Terriglobus roseus]|uniref:Soil-associated protein, TIGR03435 family n=1 Tax=Terriglobus roseus TaxID=392734 RepID=A0A1H4N102_9BACT|nr:TIGR03435 family protein [Terriglobus roseus]SEB88903.1 soil-associated protein, TIGR03435 family [Terriglobus roseus]
MKRLLSKLSILCVLGSAAWAQQPAAPSSAKAAVAFNLTDVHASPRVSFPYSNGGQLRGDRYSLRQSTLVDIIAMAYGVKPEMVQGGPSWLELPRFDIIAKADPKTSDADLKKMLQALLADRFKLVMHKGEATMPAYMLTVAGAKSKMKQSEDGVAKTCKGEPPVPGAIPMMAVSCTNMPVDELATFLNQAASGDLTEPVLNQTGLEGGWDFTLRWTDARQRAKAGAEAVSIFSAVEKDLGLKLELKTAPRPVWIVDSVMEKPTPNSPAVAKELPPPPPAEFEVSTIKPSKPDAQMSGRVANGQMNLTAATLKMLIPFIWDFNSNDPQMLVNAPAWLDKDKFDFFAKTAMPEPVPGRPPLQIDDFEFHQMLQALVIDRFQMKVHMEERPIFAYRMVADHPKLTKADPTKRTRCKQGVGADGKDPRVANPMITQLLTCQNITMKQLGDFLTQYATGYIYTSVLDDTGLQGSYDLTLAWSSASLTVLRPPPPPGQPEEAIPADAVTLYDAMDKQIGIKMVKEKRPVSVLVIDHIEETPTPN